MAAGGAQQFTATVSGAANTAVNWQVNGIAGGNALFGTIDGTGLYQAPTAPAASIVVTAVAQADTNKSASAQVTITFSNASLVGDYVFLVNVGDTNPLLPALPGFAYVGGTFHADGNGNLTTGIEDQNSRDAGAVTNISFTGTYSITADGRGSASITAGITTTPFKFVLTSSDRGQLIEFDGLEAASGAVLRQDAAAITNVTGPYVFSLLGDFAGQPIGLIGRLTSDGAGNLTGTEIVNDAGALNTLGISGTYTVGAGGRGVATVTNVLNTTQNFVFYIVNANTVEMLSIDTGVAPRAAGTAFLQTGLGGLGPGAFVLNGSFPNGGLFTAAGRFDTDNAGTITGGVFDSFSNTHSSSTLTGSYTIAGDGSGQASLGIFAPGFDLWMFAPGQAVILTRGTIPVTQTPVATGIIFAEQGGPFSAGQFKGNYGFSASLVSGTEAAAGQITADGAGAFSGNEDVSEPALFLDVALSATWSFDVNGRGSGTMTTTGGLISTTPLAFYPITPNEIIFSNNGAMGFAERQCSDCH